MGRIKTDIFIVGAGPTGLMLACQLSLHSGLSFHIIDKNAAATNQSRAAVIHARSLEVFAQLNLAQKALDNGECGNSVHLFLNGQRRLRLDLTQMKSDNKLNTDFPYALFIEQSITENLLETYLNERSIHVERNTEIIRMEEVDDDQIEITLSNGKVILTKFVCGCDGAHSFVRHHLKIPFSGHTYSSSLFVADCELENSSLKSNEASVFFTPDGLLGIFPLSKARSRLVGVVDNENQIENEQIQEVLTRRALPFDMKIVNCNWKSIYRSHHRHAERFYANRRYFLLGDAAHIHSPVGGQGMNTGLQDAHNLAWKLAFYFLHGGNERIIESYQSERHAVAEKLVSTTDRIFAFFSTKNRLLRFFITQIFSRILSFTIQPMINRFVSVRTGVFGRFSQLSISYSAMQISSASHGKFDSSHLKIGERFPFPRIDIRFFHFIHFLAENQNSSADKFFKFIRENYSTLIIVQRGEDRQNLTKFSTAAFLIRPDGYVAYRTVLFDIDHFRRYFSIYFSET